MKRAAIVILSATLASCGSAPSASVDTSAGARLEQAAAATGIVVDPASVSIVGAWARDSDRVCVVPTPDRHYRLGAVVDYGPGERCAASGTARRSGQRIDIDFGACTFRATFDGTHLVFPATMPAACDRLCEGRTSFGALAVDRLSSSVSEAATLRSPSGQPLCAD